MFISFDMDTFDPAFVPGTGTPEPGGLMPREVFPIIRRLCAESNLARSEGVDFRRPGPEPGPVVRTYPACRRRRLSQ